MPPESDSTFHADLGLELPTRATSKPRKTGRTMVIDVGWPLGFVTDCLDAYGEYIDVVKVSTLHFGLDRDLVRDKVSLYRSHGIDCEAGGPVLELATLKYRNDEVVKRLAEYYGFNILEVSATTLTPEELESSLKVIDVANDHGMKIYGEVGKKFFADGADASRSAVDELDVEETIRQFVTYFDLGAEYVYWEGHLLRDVLGNSAEELFERDAEFFPQVERVLSQVDPDRIFFEVSSMIPSPHRAAQQFWWVEKLGSDVNLANIRLEDVPKTEHIRRGTWPVFGFPDDRGAHPWYRKVRGEDPD